MSLILLAESSEVGRASTLLAKTAFVPSERPRWVHPDSHKSPRPRIPSLRHSTWTFQSSTPSASPKPAIIIDDEMDNQQGYPLKGGAQET
ncbi:GAF sensor hybrid histidine kinase [Methylorubrum populi]|uniref:GAF sensor hybrid histidine kinase n=1 Tax=Methylorubrum populi TaxID=223967 RepID=A0A160PGY7_9HYPH|nr:GAF sensor hybrid histidine kinase [Methylorubrum populi]